MKVIIDAYRGGNDTGVNINGKYEKNWLLEIAKELSERLTEMGIKNEVIRMSDVSLSDDERNEIINELKNDGDLIIQNRYLQGDGVNLIYPLRNSDALSSLISSNLMKSGINVEKYYQRRLPSNTIMDYYNVIRNTGPNETLIIEYNDLENYRDTVRIIADSLANYIKKSNSYIVKSGDSLYQIAKMYDVSVDELKEVNKLGNNLLQVGQVLIIPEKIIVNDGEYQVQKGDSLYKISKKYGVSVDELKKINNLSSNILSVGQILKIPDGEELMGKYIVQKGDSLYQIAKKYNVSVNELKKINNLSSNLLNIGQILKVPNSDSEYDIYIVLKGDSLYQIAKKNNVSVDELKKINSLGSNLLSIGQELKIPK